MQGLFSLEIWKLCAASTQGGKNICGLDAVKNAVSESESDREQMSYDESPAGCFVFTVVLLASALVVCLSNDSTQLLVDAELSPHFLRFDWVSIGRSKELDFRF